jgi:hypothetical protein
MIIKVPRTFKFARSTYDGAFRRGDVADVIPQTKNLDKCWVLAYQCGALRAYKYRVLSDTRVLLVSYNMRGDVLTGAPEDMNVAGVLIKQERETATGRPKK